jgi:hypothetical protein
VVLVLLGLRRNQTTRTYAHCTVTNIISQLQITTYANLNGFSSIFQVPAVLAHETMLVVEVGDVVVAVVGNGDDFRVLKAR